MKKGGFIWILALTFAFCEPYSSVFTQNSTIDKFLYRQTPANTSALKRDKLAQALASKEFKSELSNQLGVFFTPDSYEISSIAADSVASKMGLKVGDQLVNFGGVGLIHSSHNPLHEFDGESAPAFMLTIRRAGDTIEFGGGVKDLPLNEWSTKFLQKYYKE